MKFLVTGAGGAVGSYVVRHLVSRDHQVIAVELPGVPVQRHAQITHVPLNLVGVSTSEFEKVISFADAVIHTAAIVDIGKSKEELWDLNVTVTRRLADATSQHFFSKFVHISSGSIYAPSENKISEDYELCATNPYEESKIHSEAAIEVVGDHATDDFAWTVLRPALIYGPKARFLGATLAAIPPIMKALGVRIGVKGGPITNWVHAEDVALAAIHCATNSSTDFQTFNVADDEAVGFGDTASDYMEAYGIKLFGRIPFPPKQVLNFLKPAIDQEITFNTINIPLKAAWSILSKIKKVDNNLSVKIDKEASPFIFHNTIFDNSAIKETGFQFKWPKHKDAITSTLCWYKQNNWIP